MSRRHKADFLRRLMDRSVADVLLLPVLLLGDWIWQPGEARRRADLSFLSFLIHGPS